MHGLHILRAQWSGLRHGGRLYHLLRHVLHHQSPQVRIQLRPAHRDTMSLCFRNGDSRVCGIVHIPRSPIIVSYGSASWGYGSHILTHRKADDKEALICHPLNETETGTPLEGDIETYMGHSGGTERKFLTQEALVQHTP